MSYNNCQFTWLKQKETIISLTESLLKDGEYYDCQLFAEGQHFNVHRVILSFNSPVFSTILQEHTSDLPVITLEGISAVELGALVEFMYTGITKISPKNLKNFLQLAKSLKLTSLSDFDNSQKNKILNYTVDTNIQDNYDSYSQNYFKYLEQSELSNESQRKEEVNNFLENDESLFLDGSDQQDLGNEESVIYEKYSNEFVKNEIEEAVESGDLLVEVNNLEHNDIVESNEIEESESESSLCYSKYQSVLIKNEEKNFGENIATVYSVSEADELDLKDDSEYLEFQEDIKDTDEDENFVYVKLENKPLGRLKEVPKSNLQRNDIRFYTKKCLRVINPSDKDGVMKVPRMQRGMAKETKVNSDDKKIYICLKCGNKYSHRRTLLHHIHWICEQPATYSCSLCPYMGKRKFQLKSHMKHAHMLKMS